jgi:hypothetical protein
MDGNPTKTQTAHLFNRTAELYQYSKVSGELLWHSVKMEKSRKQTAKKGVTIHV